MRGDTQAKRPSAGGSMTVDLSMYTGERKPAPFRPVSARCQVGLARRDVTPPVGIYNRNWGAAEGDVSTGVHMPLYTTALALGPSSDEDAVATAAGPKGIRAQLNQQHSEVLLLVTVDLGWLLKDETEQFIGVICAASGLPASSVLLQLSHTHAGPSMTRPFVDPDCPGGTLAMAWWRDLKEAAAAAAHEAMEAMQPVWLSSAVGHCDLAQKRDLYDLDAQAFITAYNPWTHGEADDTLIATRIQTDDGKSLGTICNYGCHPTSMGHPTSLISPDWPGATRAALEEEYGGICVFILGACGDTMPMQGHQGDPAVTERDGRRVGLAASAALGGLPTTGGVQLEYSGPIISGAVIGQWLPHPFSQAAVAAASAFRAAELEIPVPLRPMETVAAAQATLKAAEARLEAAKAAVAAKLLPATEVVSSDDGDADVAIGVEAKVEIDLDGVVLRETALAEQARRNFRKISDWQVGDGVTYKIWVWQLGDIFIVATPGEPYSQFQTEIRRRVPEKHVIVSVNTNGSLTQGYILPAGICGCATYTDKIAVLGPGALEIIASAAAAQIAAWSYSADAVARPVGSLGRIHCLYRATYHSIW